MYWHVQHPSEGNQHPSEGNEHPYKPALSSLEEPPKFNGFRISMLKGFVIWILEQTRRSGNRELQENLLYPWKSRLVSRFEGGVERREGRYHNFVKVHWQIIC